MSGSFWKGVAAAVIAGVVLFLAQDLYSSIKDADQRAITVQYHEEPFRLQKGALKILSSEERYTVDLVLVRVSNSGDLDLRDESLLIGAEAGSPPTVLYAEEHNQLLDLRNNPELSIETAADLTKIQLPTIRQGEHVDLLLLMDCCSRLFFLSGNENIEISQKSETVFPLEDDSAWLTVILPMLMITLALVGGGFIVGRSLESARNFRSSKFEKLK